MPRFNQINDRTIMMFQSLRELTAREKKHLQDEILQVRGLMPLLMKPRNKQRWSSDDKTQLALHLQRLSQISPYLVMLAMPGGVFMLPALAWWLDRRRNRAGTKTPAQKVVERESDKLL